MIGQLKEDETGSECGGGSSADFAENETRRPTANGADANLIEKIEC